MVDEKVKQYVSLKLKMKEMEKAVKFLEKEIKDSITKKIIIDGYALSKKTKTTYSVKEDVDVNDLAKTYPQACEISVKVDAKHIYSIAQDPSSIIDEKVTEYLELRESKENDMVLDF